MQEQLRARRQFVLDHESYNEVYHQCRSWCEEFAARLERCLAVDDSRTSVESKLSELNEMSRQCRDEGAGCVQTVRDAASVVLPSTSANGGSVINRAVSELTTYWEALVNKISSARQKMEAALVNSNEFNASVSKLLQQLCDADEEHNQLSMLQSTLAEKMSCTERLRVRFILFSYLTVSWSFL